ncbi:hypothetical protein FB45DRAFT_1064948 [Roridomyces roridus]|uniref:Uncharacterized protein n=1 Tax=Roridomyces roridus TaxID=1738132 RepID=A0AAD7B9S3_9AGAR|nr:hypothetical protein FB45DRAFT_1064948 [Roridomyces roridus]
MPLTDHQPLRVDVAVDAVNGGEPASFRLANAEVKTARVDVVDYVAGVPVSSLFAFSLKNDGLEYEGAVEKSSVVIRPASKETPVSVTVPNPLRFPRRRRSIVCDDDSLPSLCTPDASSDEEGLEETGRDWDSRTDAETPVRYCRVHMIRALNDLQEALAHPEDVNGGVGSR